MFQIALKSFSAVFLRFKITDYFRICQQINDILLCLFFACDPTLDCSATIALGNSHCWRFFFLHHFFQQIHQLAHSNIGFMEHFLQPRSLLRSSAQPHSTTGTSHQSLVKTAGKRDSRCSIFRLASQPPSDIIQLCKPP